MEDARTLRVDVDEREENPVEVAGDAVEQRRRLLSPLESFYVAVVDAFETLPPPTSSLHDALHRAAPVPAPPAPPSDKRARAAALVEEAARHSMRAAHQMDNISRLVSDQLPGSKRRKQLKLATVPASRAAFPAAARREQVEIVRLMKRDQVRDAAGVLSRAAEACRRRVEEGRSFTRGLYALRRQWPVRAEPRRPSDLVVAANGTTVVASRGRMVGTPPFSRPLFAAQLRALRLDVYRRMMAEAAVTPSATVLDDSRVSATVPGDPRPLVVRFEGGPGGALHVVGPGLADAGHFSRAAESACLLRRTDGGGLLAFVLAAAAHRRLAAQLRAWAQAQPGVAVRLHARGGLLSCGFQVPGVMSVRVCGGVVDVATASPTTVTRCYTLAHFQHLFRAAMAK